MEGFYYNLAQMFEISRGCVAREDHTPISKVKVTLVTLAVYMNAFVSVLIEGFSNNMAQVLSISRRCVARMNYTPMSKVKVTLVTLAVSVFMCMLSCPGCNFLMH